MSQKELVCHDYHGTLTMITSVALYNILKSRKKIYSRNITFGDWNIGWWLRTFDEIISQLFLSCLWKWLVCVCVYVCVKFRHLFSVAIFWFTTIGNNLVKRVTSNTNNNSLCPLTQGVLSFGDHEWLLKVPPSRAGLYLSSVCLTLWCFFYSTLQLESVSLRWTFGEMS